MHTNSYLYEKHLKMFHPENSRNTIYDRHQNTDGHHDSNRIQNVVTLFIPYTIIEPMTYSYRLLSECFALLLSRKRDKLHDLFRGKPSEYFPKIKSFVRHPAH